MDKILQESIYGTQKVSATLILALLLNTLFVCMPSNAIRARSPHRVKNPITPCLKACWEGDTQVHELTNEYLCDSALFKQVDYEHIYDNLLPDEPITYRYDENKTVDGKVLSDLLNKFIHEIRDAKKIKKEYKDFKVLKSRNYHPQKHNGLLVLKFKEYPFIAKLLFKTPEAIVCPLANSGSEQRFFYVLGGGIDRYMVGFGRIKNLNAVKKLIEQEPLWAEFIELPRKWFWFPETVQWFNVTGYGLSGGCEQTVRLPSAYGVIADEIEAEYTFSLDRPQEAATALAITEWLSERIDPNISNFMIDKHTGKIVIIDTEHFPTIIGLAKPMGFKSYTGWYYHLGLKYMKDAYFRTKRKKYAIYKGTSKRILMP